MPRVITGLTTTQTMGVRMETPEEPEPQPEPEPEPGDRVSSVEVED